MRCGHYERLAGNMHLEQASTIVWIDLPRSTVMARVIRRTIRRVITREELWNGNKEPWTNLYHWDPALNVIRWSWMTYNGRQEEYERCASDGSWAHATAIRLQSRKAVRGLLESLAESVN